MKIFNTFVVWDVYVCAENEQDALEATLANIADGLVPSEKVAREQGSRPVRAAWLNEKPLVGVAVSDADFAKLKGKTTEQIWTELNKKPEPTVKKAK